MRDTIALALVRAELCRLYAEKPPQPKLRPTGRLLPGLLRRAWRRSDMRRAASPSE